MLEARVLSIVEAVLSGSQVEDDRVELKAEWPAAEHKVARQIAGHANTAGGEPILWIVGLDEGRRCLGSTSGTEPADWWNAVRRHFAEVAPEMDLLRVPVTGGGDVLTLQFSTDRAPYVVGVQGGGRVEREVPWREGNSTRTAHRHEMIRALVAEAVVPTLELIGGLVEVEEFLRDDHTGANHGIEVGDVKVTCLLDLFVSARGPAYLPEHRQSLQLSAAGQDSFALDKIRFRGSYRFDGVSPSGMRRQVPYGGVVILGNSTVEITGPGDLRLRGGERTFQAAGAAKILEADRIDVDLRLPVDRSDRQARLMSSLHRISESGEFEASATETWRTLARFAIGMTPNRWWG